MTTKSIHIDPELASRASVVLENIGIDVNDAISEYLNRIAENDISQILSNMIEKGKCECEKSARTKNMNYINSLSKEEIIQRLKQAKTKGVRAEAMGILKGMIWVSDDFDEPLEEMREYMT